MPDCPICHTSTERKIDKTPYWACPNCQTWFQDPMPPKRWHGEHETWVGHPMPEDEKRANEAVAAWLFKDFMGGTPGYTLDIGCGYPYLAYCLKKLGCEPIGIDGDGLDNDLGILTVHADFEGLDPLVALASAGQRLITFIHSFEHCYKPIEAFRKVRSLISDDGVLFIRMPDHQVSGSMVPVAAV